MAVRDAVRRGLRGGVAGHDDSDLHGPRGDADHRERSETAFRRAVASPARHGGRAAARPSSCHDGPKSRRQPGDRGQCLQHDPLAESLACGPPEIMLETLAAIAWLATRFWAVM